MDEPFDIHPDEADDRGELLRRVSALEQRLAQMEARLGIRPDDDPAHGQGTETAPAPALAIPAPPVPTSPTPMAPAPKSPTPMAPAPAPPSPVVPPPPPLRAEITPPPLSPSPPPYAIAPAQFARPGRAADGVSPSPAALPYAAKVLPRAVGGGDFEQTIGLKWAGWVGAVVVVIGAALGIKFAYDEGWFLLLPPGGRLALMSLGGFALIAAGEYVYRRIHVLAATGLFGAGVATLFLVGYAGHAYYELYAQQTALAMMSVATLVGALIAVRGDLLSIAVLALLGGNIAPLVLGVGPGEPVPLLSHLLTLQVVALALAWRGHAPKWWTLRALVLATMSIWLAAVFAYAMGLGYQRRAGFHPATLPFVLIYAGLLDLELFLSTIPLASRPRWARWALPVAKPVAPVPVPRATSKGTLTAAGGDRWVAVGFSAVVTGLLVLAVLAIQHDAHDYARGAWVIGLAGIYTLFGYLLWLVGRDNDDRQMLSIGFRAQAAALVVLAVPVALSGLWVVVGWAILSMIFATMGAVLHLRVSRWAGVSVWRLAVLALGWWAVSPVEPAALRASHAAWFHVLGTDIRAYTIMAWALAVVGHAVAWIIHAEGFGPRSDEPAGKVQRLFWVTSGMAAFVWTAGSIAGLPPVGSTLAIVVYAWLLLAADVIHPRLRLAILSAVMLLVATFKWMAVDILAARMAPEWSPLAYEPVFNPVIGMGLLLSATMALTYWRRREEWPALLEQASGAGSDDLERREDRSLLLVVAGAMIVLMAVAFSAEIDRVVEQAAATARAVTGWQPGQIRQLGWTMLWTAAATAFAGAVLWLEPDRSRRTGPLRLTAGIAIVLAVKFLVIDTIGWRMLHAPAPVTPWANLQTLTAAFVFGGLLGAWRLLGGTEAGPRSTLRNTSGFLAVLVPLWAVTFELDRVFTGLEKQFAFSIFWSAAAIGLIVAGFRFRVAGLRHFGLGLFAFTLLKVVFVDLSQARTGYRVLSFLGLGLLLLGTSVVYGKLSPRLLREGKEEDTTHADTPTVARSGE